MQLSISSEQFKTTVQTILYVHVFLWNWIYFDVNEMMSTLIWIATPKDLFVIHSRVSATEKKVWKQYAFDFWHFEQMKLLKHNRNDCFGMSLLISAPFSMWVSSKWKKNWLVVWRWDIRCDTDVLRSFNSANIYSFHASTIIMQNSSVVQFSPDGAS